MYALNYSSNRKVNYTLDFNTFYIKFVQPYGSVLQDKYEFAKLKMVKLPLHCSCKKMALNFPFFIKTESWICVSLSMQSLFLLVQLLAANDPPGNSVKTIILLCPRWEHPLLFPALSFKLFFFRNIVVAVFSTMQRCVLWRSRRFSCAA